MALRNRKSCVPEMTTTIGRNFRGGGNMYIQLFNNHLEVHLSLLMVSYTLHGNLRDLLEQHLNRIDAFLMPTNTDDITN